MSFLTNKVYVVPFYTLDTPTRTTHATFLTTMCLRVNNTSDFPFCSSVPEGGLLKSKHAGGCKL